ncbi:MAG: glycosyl hydrolase 53 family protein [Bacteroidales bacterium]
MNKNRLLLYLILILVGCSDPIEPTPPEPTPEPEVIDGFARGADISWVTEMESEGLSFRSKIGEELELTALMREVGMNAVRYRVWVNPVGGWNSIDDVLVKAKRAKECGMRIMIDFHYSDTWADPGNQQIPAAWSDYNLEEMAAAVATHTTDCLNKLKNEGIDVEWVQVGNETNTGMLWDIGSCVDSDFTAYAKLNNAGYDAVKVVYPNAKVIVHSSNGYNWGACKWLLDGLRSAGGRWDIVGLSVYPKWADKSLSECNEDTYNNTLNIINRYETPVIYVECGYSSDQQFTAKEFLVDLIAKARSIDGDMCQGVFYWEPQCNGDWRNYALGAFTSGWMPSVALDAFAQ